MSSSLIKGPTIGQEQKTESDDNFIKVNPQKATNQGVLGWSESFKEVIRASIPTVLSNIFLFLVQLTNIYFMGRSSDSSLLPAVGMGNMLVNVVCMAVCQGFNGTIETFVSQSFGGGNGRMCGVQLNRARVIVTLIFIPIAILFLFTDTILIGFGQDPNISKISRDYIVVTLPGLFAIVQFDSCKRYLQSMQFSFVATITQAITCGFHILWCYIFILKMEMGVFGAAMAINVTYILNFTIQELYVNVYKKQYFAQFRAPIASAETFSDWLTFIKLGVPTTALMCLEWWAFEFIIMFAGVLGVTELAAQVAIMNVNGLVFMFSLGVQFAASGLVGNMLGKDNPEQAKRFAICCVVVAVSLVSSLALIINLFPLQIAGMFTKDAATIALIAETLPILSLFVVLDAVHGVNAGNVRALGRQKVVSVSTLLCYYAMGLPLALIFGFQMEMNIFGFWLGYLLAMALLDIIVSYLVATADWVAKFKGTVSEVLKQVETDLEDSKTETPVHQLTAKLLQICPEPQKTN